MKRVITGLALLAIATCVYGQRQDSVFVRDAWNVKTYPAAPHLAQRAAMIPAVDLSPSASSVPELIDEIAQWNASGREPMRNGFRRTLPDSINVRLTGAVAAKTGSAAFARGIVAMSDRGTILWSTVVQVEQAHRIRLHLENVKLPSGAVLWVYGAGETPHGFGSELIDPAGSIWAPSVSGPLVYLDVEVPSATQASFDIREVMELIRTPKPNDQPTCLIDASCVSSSTFASIANVEAAIAHLEWPVDATHSGVCTGALLNDRAQDGTPYLLTANHCFSDQARASSLEAFFDYRTTSCNGSTPPVSTLPLVNGAQWLASSPSSDFTFIKLNSRPTGRHLLGWDANGSTIASSGVHLNRVSHPFPDAVSFPMPQQYSSTVIDISVAQCRFGTGSVARPQFIYSTADRGGIYGGSSGSPDITDDGHVVGQLLGSCPTGGSAASDGCDARNSTIDGAFASTYNTVATWLENGSAVTPTVCTPSATTLCLSGNRFAVSTTWTTSDGKSGQGQASALTADTGYFWFFSPSNVEMVIKVLNACSINSRIWVFAGGLTNVQVAMTVIDTKTGTVKTYNNPQSTAFVPIQDTSAFNTCP